MVIFYYALLVRHHVDQQLLRHWIERLGFTDCPPQTPDVPQKLHSAV